MFKMFIAAIVVLLLINFYNSKNGNMEYFFESFSFEKEESPREYDMSIGMNKTTLRQLNNGIDKKIEDTPPSKVQKAQAKFKEYKAKITDKIEDAKEANEIRKTIMGDKKNDK